MYEVEGMTCGGCEVAVDGAVRTTGLVDSVKSSFTDGKVYIWSKDDLNSQLIISALAAVGYQAKLETVK
jgi:copper chaperone CopZ